MAQWARGSGISLIRFIMLFAALVVPAPLAAAPTRQSVGTTQDLINAMKSGSTTIDLATGATFTLTQADNTDATGANGLPAVANNLTINGNGATIQRSTANGTPAFRIFEVKAGATLHLNNLTIANGKAVGAQGLTGATGADGTTGTAATDGGPGGPGGDGFAGGPVLGGGILNAGTLAVMQVTFTGNSATGGTGGNSGSGGVGGLGWFYQCTKETNGGAGGVGGTGGKGGDGSGGAIASTGTLTVTNSTFTSNAATGGGGGAGGQGGKGGAGGGGTCPGQTSPGTGNGGDGGKAGPGSKAGKGAGGALFSTGTMTVVGSTFSANQAQGGDGGWTALGGYGGDGGAIIPGNGTGGNGGNGGDSDSGGDGNDGDGGAISFTGTFAVINSTFTGNLAIPGAGGNGVIGGKGGNGGGPYPSFGDTGTNGNGGNGGNGGSGGAGGNANGGAIFFDVGGGSARIINSTFTGGSATGQVGADGADGGAGGISGPGGGGITGGTNGTPGNPGGPGGLGLGAGGNIEGNGLIAITTINTIVANPAAGGNCAAVFGASNTHDLQFGQAGGDCGAGFTTADPQLGSLGNNGGPTQTIPIPNTSPAYGSADPNTCAAAMPTGAGGVDQRGVTRLIGLCSIGAYEAVPIPNALPNGKPSGPNLSPPTPNPLPVPPQPSGPNLGGPAPLPPRRP